MTKTPDSSAITEPPPPTSVPRAITPLVARRLWIEPGVRFWWLSAAVLLVIAGAGAFEQFFTWKEENRLIKQGVTVSAEVIEAGGLSMRDKKTEPDSPVVLKFTFGNHEYQVHGHLAGRRETIITGRPVDIRIDPGNPNIWTYRAEPTPLLAAMLGSLLVFPLVVIGLCVAWWRWSRLKRLWKFGPAQIAIVIQARQSALAPLSKLVRCTPRGVGDKRLYNVFVPRSVRSINHGDLLWLISSPDDARSLAAAVWFE